MAIDPSEVDEILRDIVAQAHGQKDYYDDCRVGWVEIQVDKPTLEQLAREYGFQPPVQRGDVDEMRRRQS